MSKSTLTLVCGMVGSGKTTTAREIESRTGAVRLSPDEWLVQLVGSKTNRVELDRLRSKVEALQIQTSLAILQRGLNVVLEFGFWSEAERVDLAAKAKAIGASVELVFLDVPLPEIKRRIASRNALDGEFDIPIDLKEIDEWMTWFEPPTPGESSHYDCFTVKSATTESPHH